MLELSEIWIYPVKSLGGISLPQANVSDRGLEYDRRWMLVDENGVFLTQREHHELALFQTEIDDDFLTIGHKEKQQKRLKLSLNSPLSPGLSKMEVKVWSDSVMAVEVSEQASDWFSDILGFKVHLVYMPDESRRSVDMDFAVNPDDITSFSDGFPFLIIGQSSLDDLNSRLEEAVPMNRFRPNFVFTGGNPYEEESWKKFSIGDLVFYGVKPCARCVVTTIDQDKGVQTGKEPLLTLSKYRREGSKVLFGQNVIAKQTGTVKVGDGVVVDEQI